MSEPALSVVIVVGAQRERFAACLRSVLAQEPIAQIEVIVIDSADSRAPLLTGIEHPAVRLVRHGPVGSFGDLRAAGVAQATGPSVAFIEEHVQAQPGWAAALIAAFAEGWDGVGGLISNGNPGIGVSDMVGLLNFSQWLRPPPGCRSTQKIPFYNSAYRRAALLGFGEQLGLYLGLEPLLQRQLIAGGAQLATCAEAHLSHLNETTVADQLSGQLSYNRWFGATRQLVEGRTIGYWLLRGLGLLPSALLRTLRVGWAVARQRPDMLLTYLRFLPLLLLSNLTAVAATILGGLAGPGDSIERFCYHELAMDRPEC